MYRFVLVTLFALGTGACSGDGDPARGPTGMGPTIHGGAGCSLTSEPQSGSVEYAAGFIALLASVVGLRRRLRRHDDDGATEVRPRLPSIP